MSTQPNFKPKSGAPMKRVSIPDISARKGKDPVVCLTAYTTPMARLLDEACDLLLVGDSLGMVLYGMETTLGVTLDMMIQHGSAVVRGSEHAVIIIDMPFGTYEESPRQATGSAPTPHKEVSRGTGESAVGPSAKTPNTRSKIAFVES